MCKPVGYELVANVELVGVNNEENEMIKITRME